MTPSEDQQHVDFLRLYVEHEEALRGFVRALVPTREDARDVMQEVTVVLWRKIGELSAMEDFRRWAFGVARMEALTFLRDRARDRHVFGDDVLALLADEAEADADVFEAERIALEECLGKLDAAQRRSWMRRTRRVFASMRWLLRPGDPPCHFTKHCIASGWP